ncbi:DUF4328 domain-containing protein [Streptomyces sp. NPDC020681]|uniref:DUF4328 domain-containing protein n=1 Tax=Streptomyces sp. NPDC020681 TaxID=3365083 RepID=UPI00379ADE1A
MLCSECRTNNATTGEGLCDTCAVARANTALPHLKPVAEPAARLRSPVGLSKAVVALLSFVIAIDVFQVVASVHLSSLMDQLRSDGVERLGDADTELSDVLMDAVGGLEFVAFVATVVVFIVWFHRVRSNADVLAPDLQRRGRGWAIGGWFIPFGNLYIPRGIAVDVWAASRPDPYAAKSQQPHTVINFWWAAWLVSQVVDAVAGSQYEGAETLDGLKAAAVALIVDGFVDIAAAALAIVVVRRLTRMQQSRAMGGVQEGAQQIAV